MQTESKNVLATLLSSGFEAVSTNRAPIPLVTPQIRGILNDGSGRLLLDVDVVDGARCYEVDLAALDAQGAPGPFPSAGLFSRSRRMPLTGLTPGTR